MISDKIYRFKSINLIYVKEQIKTILQLDLDKLSFNLMSYSITLYHTMSI